MRDPFRGSPSESSSSGSVVPLTSSCRYGAFVGVTSDIATVDCDKLVATSLPRRRGRLWPRGMGLLNCRPNETVCAGESSTTVARHRRRRASSCVGFADVALLLSSGAGSSEEPLPLPPDAAGSVPLSDTRCTRTSGERPRRRSSRSRARAPAGPRSRRRPSDASPPPPPRARVPAPSPRLRTPPRAGSRSPASPSSAPSRDPGRRHPGPHPRGRAPRGGIPPLRPRAGGGGLPRIRRLLPRVDVRPVDTGVGHVEAHGMGIFAKPSPGTSPRRRRRRRRRRFVGQPLGGALAP